MKPSNEYDDQQTDDLLQAIDRIANSDWRKLKAGVDNAAERSDSRNPFATTGGEYREKESRNSTQEEVPSKPRTVSPTAWIAKPYTTKRGVTGKLIKVGRWSIFIRDGKEEHAIDSINLVFRKAICSDLIDAIRSSPLKPRNSKAASSRTVSPTAWSLVSYTTKRGTTGKLVKVGRWSAFIRKGQEEHIIESISEVFRKAICNDVVDAIRSEDIEKPAAEAKKQGPFAVRPYTTKKTKKTGKIVSVGPWSCFVEKGQEQAAIDAINNVFRKAIANDLVDAIRSEGVAKEPDS